MVYVAVVVRPPAQDGAKTLGIYVLSVDRPETSVWSSQPEKCTGSLHCCMWTTAGPRDVSGSALYGAEEPTIWTWRPGPGNSGNGTFCPSKGKSDVPMVVSCERSLHQSHVLCGKQLFVFAAFPRNCCQPSCRHFWQQQTAPDSIIMHKFEGQRTLLFSLSIVAAPNSHELRIA